MAGLPFELTAAQKRVIDEAVSDMATSRPMLRLIQGDVGAGKTLVAAMTACYALDSGWQVAVMAPTEILAEQHLINFQKWFEPLGIGVGWLAGKQTAKERTAALDAIRKIRCKLWLVPMHCFQIRLFLPNWGLSSSMSSTDLG